MKLLLVLFSLLATCAIGILTGVFGLLHGLVVLADRERHVRFLARLMAKKPIAGNVLAGSQWNAISALAPSASAGDRSGKADATEPAKRLDE